MAKVLTPVPARVPANVPSGPKADRLLSVPEVAERLGTSERFVRRLIAQRRIRYHKLSQGRNGHVRVAEGELDRYLASCIVETAE